MSAPPAPRVPPRSPARAGAQRRRRRDWVQLFARLICVLLAALGALPGLAGIALRTSWVQTRLASAVEGVLHDKLGLDARFSVRASAWPLGLVIDHLVVLSSDGGAPALEVDRVVVSPRLFTLLSGTVDIGDITLDNPRIRLVIEGGAPANLALKLPASNGAPSQKKSSAIPLRSLAVNGASIDVDLRDLGISGTLDDIDLDASFSDVGVIDASLSLGHAQVHRQRTLPSGKIAFDDDALCGLRARVHVSDGTVLVRRLDLEARLDENEAPGEAPRCEGSSDPFTPHRVAVALRRVRITPPSEEGQLPIIDGRVEVDTPLDVLARAVPSAPLLTGAISLQVDVRFDGKPELPSVRGRLRAKEVVLLGEKTLAHDLDANLETTPDEAKIVEAKVAWSGGVVTIKNAKVSPFAPGIPIDVEAAEIKGIRFPALMQDLGITNNTIVEWDLDDGAIRNFKGLINDPERDGPSMIGDIAVKTNNFEIFTKAYHDPRREHVLAVRKAFVRGKFGVDPRGIVFKNMLADTGLSHLDIPWVLIGFKDLLEIDSGPGTRIDLADISPLASLKLAGKSEVDIHIRGPQGDPKIEGDMRINSAKLDDLNLADRLEGHASFRTSPDKLDFTKIKATKGSSTYTSPLIRLEFDKPGTGLAVDAQVDSKGADLRDLLSIFNLNTDPRYTEIEGSTDVQARVTFEKGGPRDRCGDGVITVRALADVGEVDLYGERYDRGSADIEYIWFNHAAQERGIEVNLRSLELRKGAGVIHGGVSIREGGEIRGHFLAHDIPLHRLGGLVPDRVPPHRKDGKLPPDEESLLSRALDGTVGGEGHVTGTLDALALDASVEVSPIRIGRKQLPASSVHVRLVPSAPPRAKAEGARKKIVCGVEIPPPFERAVYDRDEIQGTFHVDGMMFGEQMKLADVTMTRQRAKKLGGKITLDRLDLGALAQIVPPILLADAPPTGELCADIDIASYEPDHPERSNVDVGIRSLKVVRTKSQVNIRRPNDGFAGKITLSGDKLSVSPMGIEMGMKKGVTTTFQIEGDVSKLFSKPELDLKARLVPTDLAVLSALSPKIERATGQLEGALSMTGPLAAPLTRGEIKLTGGSLQLQGAPLALEDVTMIARVDEREVRIVQASARAGTGLVTLSARAPLRGFEIGEMTARLDATDLRLPVVDGVDMAIDASLNATWSPSQGDGPKKLPQVSGSVTIDNFLYTRPIKVSADLDSLARRGRRTEVDVYDPDDDVIEFNIAVRPRQAMVFRNNLLEAEVKLETEELILSGTNQRFGMRGGLRVEKGGRIRLRANEFDIRQGTIRFEDPTRISPRVDLTATTDYRRYTTSATSGSAPGATSSGGAGAGVSGSAGGSWRISLHAYGDADDLKVDLTSEPGLPQDDIVLLLTVGLTRAELDQLQASNLGSTAALEALSTLSGADSAVKTALPIIDDFRFSSAYSPRTGRTEPTVTVGKRISDRVRANVTSGLSENRDIRSNVEWRLSPETSVLGNYDNLNDVTSQGLGNLGADFRIRLEF